jgi:4-hydroxy-4-methyl-2-oxoglutarate aldolase
MADEAVVKALQRLGTAVVSDACDRLGILAQASGIHRITGQGTVVGPAFTIQYVPVGTEGGTVGDYIDDLDPGTVVVLSNNGRLDCTVWGGLLSEVAVARNIAATVIDGVCRDTARADAVGYSLFARDRWMRTGKDRVRAESMQIPVALGDMLVRPGDLLVGDADGIVVLPHERAAEIAELSTNVEEAEQGIHNDAVNGMRLDEARKIHGYHTLQTRAN